MKVRLSFATALVALLSVTLIIAGVAARAQAPAAVAQRAEIEKAVADQVRAYYRALDSMDTAASAAFFSPTKARTHYQGKIIASAAAWQDVQKSAFANRQAHRFVLDEVSVLVLSPEFAVATFAGSFRNELKNGNVSNFAYSGTQLWGRESGVWKLIMSGESTLAK